MRLTAQKLDSHSHIVGQGAVVPTSAISADADLNLNDNRLLLVKALGCQSQTEDSLINSSLYFKDGELYIRDGSGTVVQITSNGRLTTQTTVITQTTSLLFGYTALESSLSNTESLARSSV